MYFKILSGFEFEFLCLTFGQYLLPSPLSLWGELASKSSVIHWCQQKYGCRVSRLMILFSSPCIVSLKLTMWFHITLAKNIINAWVTLLVHMPEDYATWCMKSCTYQKKGNFSCEIHMIHCISFSRIEPNICHWCTKLVKRLQL